MKTIKAFLFLLVFATFATPVFGSSEAFHAQYTKCEIIAFQIDQALRNAKSIIQFKNDTNTPSEVVATLQRQYNRAVENGEYIIDWCNRNIQSCKNNSVRVAFHTPGVGTENSGMGKSTYKCTYGLTVTSADRRALQIALKSEGFDPGPADGQFGPKTQAAIKAWQRSVGQTTTGKLNANQIRRLLPRKFLPSPKKTKPVQQAKTPEGGGKWGLKYVSDTMSMVCTKPGDSSAKFTWSGQCAGGIPIGEGVVKGVVGDAKGFEGSGGFVDGKSNGNWVVRFSSGRVDEGPYVDGERHGNWVDRFPDGGVDEGPYVDGERHGNWAIRFVDGRIDRGPYVDGKPNGNWVVRYANGGIDRGPYVDGKRDGLWVYRAPDGGENETCFREGQEVDERDCADAGLEIAGAGEPAVAAVAAGERFRDCPGCPEMVVVPSGSFMMGSPSSEEGRDGDEGPVHRVTFKRPFAVGVYEVTFGEWDACVSGGGCGGHRPSDGGWGRGRHPVMNVSWDDAQAYVRWLSRKTGEEYRLLSESEWEYVARAGTTTPFHTGATISTGQANYDGNYTYGSGRKGRYIEKTVEVGSYAPNRFGLYDVHGNVWEWTEDCWNDSYRGAPSDGSAWKSGDCSRRVVRGGSWVNTPWNLRSAHRNGLTAGIRDYLVGFRVARTLTP